MKFLSLNKVPGHEVMQWLEEEIPELTKYQKECIRDNEIIRFSPFEFYKSPSLRGTFLWRLTIFPLMPVFFILCIGLPVKYLLTGIWGYDKIDWYKKWTQKIGL